jgi:hypothetical protein
VHDALASRFFGERALDRFDLAAEAANAGEQLLLFSDGMGLGRVKTPTRNLRVEIPSRFRRLENQKYLRALLREDDRENNSAHSWFARVFTQPGSLTEVTGFMRGCAGGRETGQP